MTYKSYVFSDEFYTITMKKNKTMKDVHLGQRKHTRA